MKFAPAVLAGLFLCQAPFAIAAVTPDLVLHGHLDGHDNQTYRSVPFDVPAGVTRISVEFSYTGKDEKTTIDLGLLGPDGFRGLDGFRGWSGGNKSRFTIGEIDATPSYLPGPIKSGRWSLLLGIPNIRAASQADYSANVYFSRDAERKADAVADEPLRDDAAWYRGDLHMHTGHSDGSCTSQSGKRAPCPLFLTAKEAAHRGLDFIAISDHNTISQAHDVRELQAYFDRLLLVPAREVTTFQGHANVFGSFAPLDFRVGSAAVPDWNALLGQIAAIGATISINHPIRPSDERCMGCGWTPHPDVDYRQVQSIEIVNGIDADTPYSGIPFWQGLLDRGFRLTGVGGSDNHDSTQMASGVGSGQLGRPTTVVHAQALSSSAILAGIRSGKVFVDVAGTMDRALDFTAERGDSHAAMGGSLTAPAGSEIAFVVHVSHLAGGRVEIIEDSKVTTPLPPDALTQADQTLHFTWRSDGKPHWLRANVRDGDGRLALIGNPIYVNR